MSHGSQSTDLAAPYPALVGTIEEKNIFARPTWCGGRGFDFDTDTDFDFDEIFPALG
jgi:hypothetical protein